jgi:hypothetical protein
LLGLGGHYQWISAWLTEGDPDVIVPVGLLILIVGPVGPVVLVVRPAIVNMEPVIPTHEHALEYAAVPEHGLAYLGQN